MGSSADCCENLFNLPYVVVWKKTLEFVSTALWEVTGKTGLDRHIEREIER